ncbi:CPBP family intramembrane metalloprotease [Dactylosporangium aurantiacum]|uniref:CPBP family intramembrane metalloprotease n=1 Tax=Dactylosporangium aurantiacum TaxID=35754 RepID=A0A9Q9INT1_9ACTN|nr:CPBP family intramembrane glutamic endopeptidase [Dactylosporangium aurantiacum]MDG6109010.1 CPBP family intramembrane metalloprotease [Dactylosporangium aurantiacum]UWZ56490.1 CPBP family intramembrane metalloprotease [Dactylosporangium aurantiacum]
MSHHTRPLALFAAVALPTGWLLLSAPPLLDLPVEPFVLLTLALALVLPAALLVRREHDHGVRRLLHDGVRLPRPWWLLLPATALIPALTWAAAALAGSRPTLAGPDLAALAISLSSSVLIVNLWEEIVWTGFVQRRAMARWGTLGGSLVTTALFAGIHLPLAFAGGGDAGAGLAALAVSGLGLRLLAAAADRWSGGSLLTVAILHASFNTAGDVVRPEDDWLRYAATAALGLLALAAMARRRTTSSTGGAPTTTSTSSGTGGRSRAVTAVEAT